MREVKDEISFRSTDGRTVRVEFGMYTFSPDEAFAFGQSMVSASIWAERVRDMHERHVNLKASCPLCVYEAGWQVDRLEYDTEGNDEP